MSKVLGQAGTSLADVYDVEGSVAGVEELLASEVSLVHEMGQTLFSERYSQRIFRAVTPANNQSANFSVAMNLFPTVAARLLGVVVLVDTAGRVTHATVSAEETTPGQGQEIPVWAFDGTNTDTMRFSDDGTVGNQLVLRPEAVYTQLPNMLSGTGAIQQVQNLNLRGVTSAFGAGTVTLTVLAHIGFADIEGVSSRGLPLPGW